MRPNCVVLVDSPRLLFVLAKSPASRAPRLRPDPPTGPRVKICSYIAPAGNERRKHIRNAREFAVQPGGWPFEHIIVGPQGTYDTVVGKWKKTFKTLLSNGDIDEGLHERILCNLKPACPINADSS